MIGDKDQFTTVEELEGYANQIDAAVHVLSGSDHFFYFREEKWRRWLRMLSVETVYTTRWLVGILGR